MEILTVQKPQQQLTLSPSLRLSLQVLQMSRMELQIYLSEQQEENPLLELSEERQEPEEKPSEEKGAASDPEPEVEELWGQADTPSFSDLDPEEPTQTPVAAKAVGLHDHLLLQLRRIPLLPPVLRATETLLGWLDPDGFLRTSLPAIGEEEGLDLELLEQALAWIQRCDPPGSGARNLAECLLIQLAHRNQSDGLAARILKEQFDLLRKRKVTELARHLRVSIEEVQEAFRTISRLDPKPARNFSAEPALPILPDLLVRHTRSGNYEVALNDEDLPRLSLNHAYLGLLRKADTAEETKNFLRQKLKQGMWLLKAVAQRNATVLAIAQCVVRLEAEYFKQGVEQLRALTQEEVARQIGCHPSTVSRAIAGKTLQTPFGAVALEYFFGGGVPNPNEEGHRIASQTIRLEIQRLVSAEDPNCPLSDQTLVEILIQRGFPVARRTVAKYRDQLRILPARLRRNLA